LQFPDYGSLFACVPSWNSNAPFPLTPALSPRERENRSPVFRQSPTPLCSESRNACLPLPKGEGRGEGEGDGRQHDGYAILGFKGARRATISGRSFPEKRAGVEASHINDRSERDQTMNSKLGTRNPEHCLPASLTAGPGLLWVTLFLVLPMVAIVGISFMSRG